MKLSLLIEFSDGTSMEAASAPGIVRQMFESQPIPISKTKPSYMMDVARRCGLWDGARVSIHNAWAFLHDLEKANVLTITIITEDSKNVKN